MKIEEMNVLLMVLDRCNQQAEYYKRIADKGDYKDETVNRFVNLGIAYEDVSMYIQLLLDKNQVQGSFVGDPVTTGQLKNPANDTIPNAVDSELKAKQLAT